MKKNKMIGDKLRVWNKEVFGNNGGRAWNFI